MLCFCPALATAEVLAANAKLLLGKRSVRVWVSSFTWGFTWGVGSGELRWFEATSFFSSGFSFTPVVPVLAKYHAPEAGTARFELCVPAGWTQLPGWLPKCAGLVWGELRHHAAEGLCAAPCLQVCTAAPLLHLKLDREGTQALERSAWERDGVAHLGTWLLLYLAVPD